ncbi:MAG TPA: lipid-A-disaccharide synthase N-terminal domain-containing protein [Planctomycetota bacterium]|nr:lipid-A-disaccharide synthase N-terminal domain-containing protein [Planctomycetota bacterium]
MTDGAAAPLALVAIGALGQACFFSRFLLQWLASERAKRSSTPSTFWRFSLAGTALSGVYAWLGERDLVFAIGYAFNLPLYGRNLALSRRGARPLPAAAAFALGAAAAAGAAALLLRDPRLREALGERSDAWLAVGFAGQAIWSSRFLVQWLQAERSGSARLTRTFFVLTLAGWAGLFPYAIHLRSGVFVVGLLLTPFVAIRNLVLFRRGEAPPRDAAVA